MKADNSKEVLYLIEPNRRANPIMSRAIEQALNIKGAAVRDCVRHLRRQGMPICMVSSSKDRRGGYYYSDNPQDIEEMKENLRNRVRSIAKTIAMFEQHRSRAEHQQEMFAKEQHG